MRSSFTPHILVVANETSDGTVLHRAIRDRARARGAAVTVVAPALNSRLRHWLSDEDPARAAAGARLARCLEDLAELGVPARGHVGDADPMRAIADVQLLTRIDELIIATPPEERSNWLAQDLPSRAAAAFGVPVLHVVVDVHARRAYVAAA